MEEKTIDQSDIELVKALQNEYAITTAQIGQVEVELHLLEKRLTQVAKARESLFTNYESLETKEKDLVETLSKKYGDGVLDLDLGKFIPTPQ